MSCRTLSLLTAACLTTANLVAADASFVGKWKINLDKSTLTGFQEKIEDLGDNRIKMTFGDDEDILIADGKEHPTKYGTLRTVTPGGPNHWKAEGKRDGKITRTEDWTVSDEGKTLTVLIEGIHADGTAFKSDFKAKRVAGTTGIMGTWENTNSDPNSFPDMEIESYEGDGLTFFTPTYKERDSVKFDGKDYPNEGPRVAPGATTAGKRIDERTIELTDKLKGKVLDTQRLELSADGKTLTGTFSFPGIEKKEIHILERQ